MQGLDVATPQDAFRRRRRRVLPRGRLHAAREVVLWAGFALAYEAARGAAAHEAPAMRNARDVVELERRLVGLLELDLQRPLLRAGGPLLQLADWTYWLAQFVVVALVLVWIYLRRNDAYPHVRNAVIAANTVGLAGYVLFPLAPPRLLPGYGFVDALARAGPLDHRSGIVELFSNPYAAMPSLHTADALLLGLALATLARRPVLRVVALLWPVWVSFCLVATGNHYWLDIAVGAIVAAAAWIATDDARKWIGWLPSPGRAGNPQAIQPGHGCPRETSHRQSVRRGKETRMGATIFNTTASPPGEELVLTPEGYTALVDEHRALTAVKRPEASARLSDALEIAGDLADNAEYLHARAELDLIEARIEILEDRLSAARVMRPEEGSGDIVGLGSEVVLEDVDDGTRDEYLLVSSPESNPARGRLSNESPVGAAIAGHRCGEIVDVRAPHAVRHVRIVGVRGRRRRAARP